MTYTYREALSSDAVKSVKILCDYFDETHWLPYTVDPSEISDIETWWRDHFQNEMAWVAENEGRIVGFCSRQLHNNNISALYVVPLARNCGVGKNLLDLAKVNCDQIIVWAFELNKDARKFYHREGLVEVDREIDDELNIVDIEHHWVRS